MRFRVLGVVTAETEQGPVHLSDKPRLALAVLIAAERRPVSADDLIAKVWDGGDLVRDAAHSCVSDLRAQLRRGDPGADGVIPKREHGYRLLVDPQDVDLHRFRALAKELRTEKDDSRVASLGRRALREWGEDLGGREPLAGVDGRWAIGYRKRLREEHHGVLLAYLEAEARLGHAPRLLPELEALHGAAPYDERIVRPLMLAYHQVHDRKSAIELYTRFQRDLADQCSADPAAETRELYRRIFEQDPTLRLPPDTATPGNAMPKTDIPDLAHRMTEVLTPELPFLTGAEVPHAQRGGSWHMAKALWSTLLRRQVVPAVPDPTGLRVLLEDALSRDAALAEEAAAILAPERTTEAAGQINISGPYFHQGDNISGTSIKYYGG